MKEYKHNDQSEIRNHWHKASSPVHKGSFFGVNHHTERNAASDSAAFMDIPSEPVSSRRQRK
jgi:hypothetical protein